MNKFQQFVARVFGIQETIDHLAKYAQSQDKQSMRLTQANIVLQMEIDALEGENENLRRTNEILADTNRDLIAAAKKRHEQMEVLIGKTAA